MVLQWSLIARVAVSAIATFGQSFVQAWRHVASLQGALTASCRLNSTLAIALALALSVTSSLGCIHLKYYATYK